MIRFARRQYLIGSIAAIGSVVAAACDREAAPPPADTAPPPARHPTSSWRMTGAAGRSFGTA